MKYVSTFNDRHGITRHRFRKTGCKTRYLKSQPGTPKFEAEIERALNDEPEPKAERPPLPMLSLFRQLHGVDPKRHYVYFIEAENGLIKIGHTASIRERFKKLNTAVPMQLTLLRLIPGDQELERALHAQFAEHRVTGEWFSLDADLRRAALGTNAEQSLTKKSNRSQVVEKG
jgi:hypothetical protein